MKVRSEAEIRQRLTELETVNEQYGVMPVRTTALVVRALLRWCLGGEMPELTYCCAHDRVEIYKTDHQAYDVASPQ